MTNYKHLYFLLFNGITDIMNDMETATQDEQLHKELYKYICRLQKLQLDAEEKYIEQE